MSASLEFILGLLGRDHPAHAAAEDFAGEHGEALRLWQRLGLLSREPGRNPVASCPHCGEGVPYAIRGRHRCNRCGSAVERRHLRLWRFDLDAFLGWLARALRLTGQVRQVDEHLWQLGSFRQAGVLHECFFRRNGPLSERGSQRLLAFRNALLLEVVSGEDRTDGFQGPRLSLLEILRLDHRGLGVADLTQLLRRRGEIRFDEASGAVWAGDAWLGEVPLGSKEYHLLACLWRSRDRFVPYADLKHYVLRQSDSTDTTEEATFCQRLKNRLKKAVPEIDRLIAKTNKADGYRLRGHLPGEL
jgi:hypothetical protein